jgi:rhodanese-related sulfurtransferase
MDSQYLFYGIAALVLVFSLRNFLRKRKIKNYSPSELAPLLKKGSAIVLLDVRTPGERSSNHIAGSLHIPLNELAARVGELQKHIGKEIVCYCQRGNRSITAAGILSNNGFTAANLTGGIAEWNFSQRL